MRFGFKSALDRAKLPALAAVLALFGACSSSGKKHHGGGAATAGTVDAKNDDGLGERQFVELTGDLSPEKVAELALLSKSTGDKTVLINRSGGSWELSEKDGALIDLSVSPYGKTDAFLYVTGGRSVWAIGKDDVGHSKTEVQDGQVLLSTLDGIHIAPPKLQSGEDPDPLTGVIGVTSDTLLVLAGTSVQLYRFQDGKLSVEEISLPQGLFDDKDNRPLAAGTVADGKGYWFLTKAGLRIASRHDDGTFGWLTRNLKLGIADDDMAKVKSVGLFVSMSGDSPRVEGAILVKTDRKLFMSPARGEKKPLVKGDIGRLSWIVDVKPLAAKFCVGCHNSDFNLSSEDTWHANKDKILTRIAVSAKNQDISMPPSDSQEAKSIQDSNRATIIAWLDQPPVVDTGAGKGQDDGNSPSDDGKSQRAKIEGEFLTQAKAYCLGCHADGVYLDWWTDHKVEAADRVKTKTMPQMGSAQAQAIDQNPTTRQHLIDLINSL